jgi:hypothetical protein
MFKLYTQERDTLNFHDYATIMKEAAGKKKVLEIGPGLTTLALIEAGVEKIVSLENDPEWLEKKREEFKEYPQVTLGLYHNKPVVEADRVALQDFELALVDGPAGFVGNLPGRKPRVRHPGMEDCSRLNTCLFALKRAPIVLLHDAHRACERATLGRLSGMGHQIQFLPSRWGLAKIWRRQEQNSSTGH